MAHTLRYSQYPQNLMSFSAEDIVVNPPSTRSAKGNIMDSWSGLGDDAELTLPACDFWSAVDQQESRLTHHRLIRLL